MKRQIMSKFLTIKTLKRTLIATIVLSLLGGVALAPASTAAAKANRYITISADGTVKVAPDAVRINFTVTTIEPTTKEALSVVASSASAVRASLLANKVASKDLSSQGVSIYPEYNYTQEVGQTLIGYRASQSFVVIIRKANTAGAVDSMVMAGGDSLRLEGVSPFVLNSSKAIIAARTLAVKNAKSKASSYASLLGIKLDKVNYLVENSSPVYSPPIMMGMEKDSAGSTQIDLGLQNVTVSITVQWSLR